MAFTVSHNKGQSFVIQADTNTNIVLVGNDSVSNVALTGEVITGTTLKQAWCGSSSGNGQYWVVEKGNSTANSIVAVFDSTAYIDFAGNGSANDIAKEGANLFLTIHNPAGGTGYVRLEFKKVGTGNS